MLPPIVCDNIINHILSTMYTILLSLYTPNNYPIPNVCVTMTLYSWTTSGT